MLAPKPIQIVGGGLAGLALGIALRRREIPVTIHETGRYPRHRVCGEFISGRGQESLARLGLRELIEDAGAVAAHTAAFFTATKSTSPRQLPVSAICLSRFKLDAALAGRFGELGGNLLAGEKSTGDFAEGMIRATGRRAAVGPADQHWFGLKIHARNVSLAADLEMHVSARGYVGLCQLGAGEVNICGLFRKGAREIADDTPRSLLRGRLGSRLHERLAGAAFDEDSFCAVAGLSLQPQRAAARPEICIGDSITMIPPVTGNGMSMAFESAELAVAPLAAWSRGELSWSDARRQIARDCDAAFARRLFWAWCLQRVILTPSLQDTLVMLAARSGWFWRMAFEQTR